jgi:Arc/MetJ-type ribon-helix-helix transcriptional regulator
MLIGVEAVAERVRSNMTIELKPEQQRLIDLGIRSGAFHNTDEVIDSALSMLAEDIEDSMVSEARSQEQRWMLPEVEAELRALGKLK